MISDVDYGEGRVVHELEYKRAAPRPETLFYHGPFDQTRWLLEEVRRLNVFRKVQIHCVGIGDADVGLLRGIANATMGEVYLFGRKAKAAGTRGR